MEEVRMLYLEQLEKGHTEHAAIVVETLRALGFYAEAEMLKEEV